MRVHVFLLVVLQTVLLGASAKASPGNNEEKSGATLEDLLKVKVSTAAKYEQTASEAPASVSIITADDIERYGYRTLDEVFQSVSGFYTSYDRNYRYLGTRGFSRPSDYNNRILLLMNGHTLNENVFGAAAIGTELALNLDDVERIEIVRGPGSALYGTEAMFAVINIIAKSENLGSDFRLSAETGSYGRMQSSTAFGKAFANGMKFRLSGTWADIQGQDVHFSEFNTPATNNGVADNLDSDNYCGAFSTFEYRDLCVQGMLSSRNKKVPTAPFGSVFDNQAWTEDRRAFVEFKYDHSIHRDKNIMLRGYYDDYERFAAFTVPRDLGGIVVPVLGKDKFDGNWLGGEAQLRWDIASNSRLIAGSEYQEHLRASDAITAMGVSIFKKDAPFSVVSFYLQEEYQATHDVSFTAGMRLDKYSTVGPSFTPRGAIVYTPTETSTAKLLYGEAFRAPNLFEIVFGEPIPGAKINPNLRPERIRTLELVWEQRLSRFLLGSVSLFDYRIRDLIDKTLVRSESALQYQNISNANVRGLEVELNARLGSGLNAYANYALQRAEATDSGARLTNSPSHLAKLGLFCPVRRMFNASAELQYQSGRATIYRTRTDAFLLTNAKLSSKLLFRHVRTSLQIRNLFDVSYATPGGFEHVQPAFKQDGRNFDLKVEYRL